MRFNNSVYFLASCFTSPVSVLHQLQDKLITSPLRQRVVKEKKANHAAGLVIFAIFEECVCSLLADCLLRLWTNDHGCALCSGVLSQAGAGPGPGPGCAFARWTSRQNDKPSHGSCSFTHKVSPSDWLRDLRSSMSRPRYFPCGRRLPGESLTARRSQPVH